MYLRAPDQTPLHTTGFPDLATVDTIIKDLTVKEGSTPGLTRLLTTYGMEPNKGTKEELSDPLLISQFEKVYKDSDFTEAFGGSALNATRAMMSLLRGAAEQVASQNCQPALALPHVKFFGTLAGEHGEALRRQLYRENIIVMPNASPTASMPTSYVVQGTENRLIRKDSSSAPETLNLANCPRNLLTDVATFICYAQIFNKIGSEVMDHVLDQSEKAGQGLILAFPTDSKPIDDASAEAKRRFESTIARTHKLLPKAIISMCNETELGSMYDVSCKTLPEVERAVGLLRADLRQDQVALVTNGGFGAYVLDGNGTTLVKTNKVDAKDIVSVIGSGDTTAGAFMFLHHLLGMDAVKAAIGSTALGTRKVKTKGSHLPNAWQVLKEDVPDVAERAVEAMQFRAALAGHGYYRRSSYGQLTA